MKFLHTLTFTIFLFMTSFSYSQRNYNEPLGNLTSFNRNGQTLNLITDHGKVALTVYDEGIIRIRIVKNDFIEKFSYAVIGSPSNTDYRFNDDREKLIIETDLIKLEISKTPVRFSFYSADGTLLSSDDPAFGTSWIGTEVTTYKTLQKGERFVGLGEKTGNLDRQGNAYDNWNTDNPRYGADVDPLYVTIPFYMGVLNGKCYGIFMDNSYRSHFNFGASNDRFSSFGADDGEMDYYFMHDSTMSGILQKYSNLTGKIELPPLWSLGYQQCRWSYFPDAEVLNIARNFRERKIPLDVLYLDIHYMDAYKIFTWHPVRFNEPAKLINSLKEMGIHTTVIVDPGIKVENGYEAYEDGVKKGVFATFPDGELYTAQVWPGWCHFPDFTMPKAREWWGSKFTGLVNLGVDGFWNDMNEIASWGGGNTPHLVNFNWEGQQTTYKQAKNIYGMQMARSTYEGTKKLMNNRRPFILTRAAFSGFQRYSALWTGDNQSTDEHLMLGARLVNSLGLSGVPFVGVDVGGFSQNASPALFARWMSLGTFTPFFRSHTHYDTKQAEPWSFGETVENICRNYITFRYKMLPYIYSSFYQSSIEGIPVARSLALDYTHDEKIYWYSYQHEYLFGPSFLIIPVESNKELVKVYLPEGNWYDFHTDKYYEGNSEIVSDCPLSKLPVFVKAGAIIPLQNAIQSTSDVPGDTLYVHLYNGPQRSEFTYYEDDGVTYNYNNQEYHKRLMVFDPQNKTLTFNQPEGRWNPKYNNIQILFHGFSNDTFLVNGNTVNVFPMKINLLNALPNDDPAFIENLTSTVDVFAISLKNQESNIVISWK